MDKLKEIRSFDDLKEFIKLNRDMLKKAALPIAVAAALLFFWVSGGDESSPSEDISIEHQDVLEETQDSIQTAGDKTVTPDKIYVDISGCVKSPGVYQVDSGTRIFQVIERAGGTTDDADVENINRAEEVYDGQKIVIYAAGQEQDTKTVYEQQQDGKININKADSSKLQEIPGVGPATAQKIIEYRQSSGNFSSIEELMEISGIGQKLLRK